MLTFETDILKRRRIRPLALLLGLSALILLGLYFKSYHTLGTVPVVHELAQLLGLEAYLEELYLIVPIFLSLLLLPTIQTFIKRKQVVSGKLVFDTEHVKVSDGKHQYQFPKTALQEMEFELASVDNLPRLGGDFMCIPTKNGQYRCEFQLGTIEERETLLAVIEQLSKEDAIVVKVKMD